MVMRKLHAKHKIGFFAILLGLTFSFVSYSLGPSGETQWFSSEIRGTLCEVSCFDPEGGSPHHVRYEQVVCEADWWGTCASVPCGLSCRDLLLLNIY